MFIMTAEGVFFANQGTLTVVGTTGGPSPAANINAVANVTVNQKWAFAKLYAWGSNQRLGVKKFEEDVEVDIDWVKWDPTVTTWWAMYIMNSAAGGTTADTNDVVTFTLTFSWTNSAGTIMKVTVSEVYFENLPIADAKQNEWMHMKLHGYGKTMTVANA